MTPHSIHYEIHGDGIPLLFMHGLGGSLGQSQEMLNPICGVRKILVDCPAHGQSSVPDITLLSFDFMADQLIKLMDSLNIRQFLVGGISMGSAISMNMMVRYSDRILGAILVRPAWLDQAHPYNLALMELSEELINQTDPYKLFESSPEFIKLKNSIPNAAKSLMSQFNRPQGLKATMDLLRTMINDAPLQNLNQLSSFEKPVCIIVNEKDPMHPAEFGNKIYKELPQNELHKVFPKYFDADRHHLESQKVIQAFIQRMRSVE